MTTIEELQQRLAEYRACERAILSGSQSYQIGSISYTYADLRWVQTEIRRLENALAHRHAVTASGGLLSHSQAIFRGRR